MPDARGIESAGPLHLDEDEETPRVHPSGSQKPMYSDASRVISQGRN
jgi:hypothetical protein